ncbi:MAG TPA: Spx/MgsR family RNA polymerase-binding regulatory protein [Ferruginibacter sp.]|nr:arsenate reductase [Chitinophagaceae bacterium]HRI23280.1 Spx/MgsR family RNA polymerase-binding regulatory protein [Ferruginibacter sp.]
MAEAKLYGIPNCDTTKKAMTWLNKNRIPFSFHDYKQAGISEAKLNEWIGKKGLDTIFNKRSTTWKELPEAEQEKVNSPASAVKVMIRHNSIIKRPIIENGNSLLVGYNETEYNKQLKQ